MQRVLVDASVRFVWALANGEACFSQAREIEPVHFLAAGLSVLDELFHHDAEEMGLPPEGIQELTTFAEATRARLQVDPAAITVARRELRRRLRGGGTNSPELRTLHRSADARGLFVRAGRRALAGGRAQLTLDALWDEIVAALPEELRALFPKVGGGRAEYETSLDATWLPIDEASPSPVKPTTHVDRIGRDLTRLARDGRLAPVVGRQAEIRTVARHLLRSSKRAVLLIGDPGVGKTAIVEGLASRIVAPDARAELRALRIVQLNVADLIAGSKYRGDLEHRLQSLLAEAQGDPHLVLFIDEIHLVMGSGSSGGALDVANMLKPYLARDDLRCIGATTLHEFERFVRPDGAFVRRFQILTVTAPTVAETVEILAAWSVRIERQLEVRFDPDAVTAAAQLADRHLGDRALPDPAIDLLENAATMARVSSLTERQPGPSKTPPLITRREVERALVEFYGVRGGSEAVFERGAVQSALAERLVGQDKAVTEIAQLIGSLGFSGAERHRALAVLLFVGPTGVGKTFAAECLSHALFAGDSARFLRVNLSELRESHDLARLTGAPPGFIGHDREAALFSFARQGGRRVVLLDELDKAHSGIHDYFLQIFDQGTARDTHGHAVDFRHVLFVATANQPAGSGAVIGFDQPPADHAFDPSSLGLLFRPEFLARFDRIVEFQEVGFADLARLLRRKVEQWTRECKSERGVEVVIEPGRLESLARVWARAPGGVRGFLREMERHLLVPLRQRVATMPGAGRLEVSVHDGVVVFGG